LGSLKPARDGERNEAVMKKWRSHLLILLWAWCFHGPNIAHADLDDDHYRVPLIGNYAVYRNNESSGEWGKYQLVEINPPLQEGSFGFAVIVPKVEKIAVVQNMVVGQAGQGLFLFDTSKSDPTPEFFGTSDKWRAALVAAGISVNVQLRSPDTLAVHVPDKTLHPWDYRAMHGWLGFSDGVWSLIVQACGLVAAFIIGLRVQRKSSLIAGALALGILVDVIGQMFMAGEGPAAFVGFFMFPVLFYFVALIGKGVRRVARGRRKIVAS